MYKAWTMGWNGDSLKSLHRTLEDAQKQAEKDIKTLAGCFRSSVVSHEDEGWWYDFTLKIWRET